MTQNQMTVLIVDNCQENQEIYHRYLRQDEQYRYRILQVESGQKALEICQQEQPDAILIDVMLPDITVLDFIRQLKIQSDKNYLPLVVLAGQNNEEIAITALRNGASNYLITESLDAVSLQVAVYQAIQQNRLVSELKRTQQLFHASVENMLEENRRAEAKLRKSEQIFRVFADNIEAIIWIASPDSQQHFYISPAYEKIWNCTCDSLRHQPQSWIDAVHVEDKPIVIAKLEQQKQGQQTNVEFRIRRPDGSIRWIWDRGFPIHDEQGQISYYAGIAEDITERKQLQAEIRDLNETLELRVMERTSQLQTANNELEAFTYTVSHDLRAPLRIIQGFAEALLEDCGEQLDELAHEYIHRIIQSAQRSENLIQDLLAYSRLSRADLYLYPVNLYSVIFEVQNLLESEITAKQAQITIQSPLPKILAHRQTLAQVITNLLTNAIKFVSDGTQPQILIYAEEKSQGWVRLWVKDNGIGIKPEHFSRIFNVFERLHGIERYAGTGIGLAIVRKGVKRMGGNLGVESFLGQGSNFWIELHSVAGDNDHGTHHSIGGR